MYDCLCTGIIVADHICAPVERVPEAGGLVLTSRMELAVGGCASNVALDLAKLGLRPGLVGTVGRDAFGGFVRERLEAGGVDCRHLAESESRETSGTLVINVRGEDRRFIHSVGANAEFTGREVPDDLVRDARSVYLGGYLLCDALTAENAAALFEAARTAGAATLLDVVVPGPGDYRTRLEPVLPWTDVFLPNRDEAQLLTGLDDPLEQAEAFHRAGAGTVVVTCGGEGAVLVNNHVRLRAGRYDVEFVDGTGSGDAFVAGYVAAMLAGRGVEDCLRLGSALGASCVRAAGATTGVFTAHELAAFVADNDLSLEPLERA